VSLRANGEHRCDRSGRLLENGNVQESVIVTDLDPETGGVRILHFCREDGCAKAVLSKRNLIDLIETTDKGSGT
jgi:hypothetical protein